MSGCCDCQYKQDGNFVEDSEIHGEGSERRTGQR